MPFGRNCSSRISIQYWSIYFQEPSGAADDSNEDEENDVTVEDVDMPTGRLSMKLPNRILYLHGEWRFVLLRSVSLRV